MDDNPISNAHEEEDTFFEADDHPKPSSSSRVPSSSSRKTPAAASSTPFDDGSEPDFAGWLAAQAQKKSGAKALPKGLSKASGTSSAATGKKPAVVAKPKTVPKTVVKKKIDTKPRETAGRRMMGGGLV
ncbi:Nuclear aminoacylation-dependent tRNA export pathway component [Collariella sp. IMI 366227]|nr:Nuclear aminoacylation-dependent tRNA export pathway component [Collariella sp. IMI 366227]